MDRVGGEGEGRPVSIKQVAFASFVGTAIEWYDYFLYATAAALVFNGLFFPNFAPLTGTLASFATFGVGFVARPVGGVVFGHFGDRIGRKSMLVITLLLMGGATFLIGCLPTFETAGILAPILLVVLRFIQGFAVGGEWGGAILMAVEHAPEEERNFYASWPQLGSPAGLILSTAVFTAFSSLPEEQFLSWGWRVPFLLSIVLIGVGLFIRLRVLESPAFKRVRELGAEVRVPLLEVLRRYPLAALLSVGVVLVNIGGFYLVVTFTLAYATEELGVGRNVTLIGLLLAGVAEIVGILLLARTADRVGRRPVALGSAAVVTLFAFPFFWLVDTASAPLIWLAMSFWTFAAGALYGVTGAFISELFDARVRYSGISLGYQMAGVLGGAVAPLLATFLVQQAGGDSWPVATYLFAMSLVSLLAVFFAADRFRVAIDEDVGRLSAGLGGAKLMASFGEMEHRVLEKIDENWDREVGFLRGLVRRPSTLGNEAHVQRFVAEELREMGLEPDVWEIDPAEISSLPGYSPVEWSYAGRPNVATVLGSSTGDGRSLVFNGHVDVVPATPEHHWTVDPWGAEVIDGRMYGRGAADMKAGVAAMIYATRALMESGVGLAGDLILQTVIEEECTGNGALAALARGHGGDAAIIPEPFGRRLLGAQVGVMWARVTVRGRGAHAERASDSVNAILAAAPLMEAVKELEREVNDPSRRHPSFESVEHPLNYNIGVIRGGDWASSVPEECVFEVRLSCYPGEDLREVESRFKDHLLERAKQDPWLSENPPEIAFYAFRAEGCTIDGDEPVVSSLLRSHERITGERPGLFPFTGTTDARFFNLYHGIPATCYGPAGANLHAPDEWVTLQSVREATKVLALSAVDWCGTV